MPGKQKPSQSSLLDVMSWPRKYRLGVIGGLIVILSVVTVWSNWGGFVFKDTADYEAQRQEVADQRQRYQALLAAIDVSPKDSEAVLKKIATEDVVKQEINDTLQANQRIIVPEVSDTELAIAPRNDKTSVESYLQTTVAMAQAYNQRIGPASQVVFTDLHDKGMVASAAAETAKFVQNLRGTPVPPDMLPYHKAQIVAYQHYADFLGVAQNYDQSGQILSPRGEASPWPQIYRDYVVINNRTAVINSELQRVDQKFALGELKLKVAQAGFQPQAGAAKFGLVKPAQAFLGFGDLSVTVGDIPRIIMYGVQIGLAKAFTQFVMSSIDKLVAKIDKYFTITSELYYSQELGKLYTKEYWTKFNVAKADQSIMQNFLPQYFCAPKSATDLKRLNDVFKAKSKQLLKYDVSSVPLESPDYYTALNDLGKNSAALIDPWSYWRDIYTSQAQTASVAAADAVDKEIKGTGLKSGRDLLSGAIAQNVNKLLHVQGESVTEALKLGNSNADNIVSTLIAGVFESVTTKFIFTAVSSGQRGGGLSTIEEQPLCISTPKVKPVVPGGASEEELEEVDQARVQSCKTFLQLYDEAAEAGATGLNDDVAAECRELVAQADAQPAGP